MRRNSLTVLMLFVLASVVSGCSTDLSQSGLTFACGPDKPCAEGYECVEHPELGEKVCVVDGTTFADAADTSDLADGADGSDDADAAHDGDASDVADADPDTGEDAAECEITYGGQEKCDGVDNDCNGIADDWCSARLLGTFGAEGELHRGKDWANDIAVDTAGHVFIVGYVGGEIEGQTYGGGNRDAFVAKYSDEGSLDWVRLLGSEGDDQVHDVALDDSGNIYVTGYTNGELMGNSRIGGWDAFLAKLDSNGELQWLRMLGTAEDEQALGVALGGTGSDQIYITGVTKGALDGTYEGQWDAFLARYDDTGAREWVRQLGTSTNDMAKDVVATGDGSVHVAGWTAGDLGGQTSNDGRDAFVVSYGASGARENIFLRGTAGEDQATSVAADASGNIYIAGRTTGEPDAPTSRGDDAFVARITNGPWMTIFGSTENEWAEALAVDSTGDIHVTGWTLGEFGGMNSAGNRDIFVSTIDSTSGEVSGTSLIGSDESDAGFGVALDSLGGVYITGYTAGDLDEQTNNGGLTDAFVAKLH